MFENNGYFNQILTSYAQGAFQNPSDLDLSTILFTPVEVDEVAGSFDKYIFGPAFTAVETSLTRDNSPRRIALDKTQGNFNVEAHALEISRTLLQSKAKSGNMSKEDNLRMLMSAQYTSRQVSAVKMVKDAITPMSGKGVWSSETADVLGDINAMLRSIVTTTAQKPNKLLLGRTAWSVIRNHPALKERFAGLSYSIETDALASMLDYTDVEIIVSDVMAITTPGTTDLTELLANDVIAMFNDPAASRNDLSAGKEFTMTPAGPEVLTYVEHAVQEVDTLFWSSDRQITNAGAFARIALS